MTFAYNSGSVSKVFCKLKQNNEIKMFWGGEREKKKPKTNVENKECQTILLSQ
jgi:hypothetical protein